MAQSSTVSRLRSTKYICGSLNGENVKITYFTDICKALNNILALNRIEKKIFTAPNLGNIIKIFPQNKQPTHITLYKVEKGLIKTEEIFSGGDIEPLLILNHKSELFIIKTYVTQEKCQTCGTLYSTNHNCNVRKTAYFHHIVNKDTRTWWQPIKFHPVGCVETKRLYVVYDIETYTYHSKYGKQLVPYLLVFQLFGEETLIDLAKAEAEMVGYTAYDGCFYILNKDPEVVGQSFKLFRSNLQDKVTNLAWERFCEDNALDPYSRITAKQLQKLNKSQKLNKTAEPQFYEIIIVGHNISGFDEIVLASHILDNVKDKDYFVMFNITRNFLPRAGKLLFNDITFSLPNPQYKKPSRGTFDRWQNGMLDKQDLKWQGVKFMVRDTYLLTHTSLRNAATAYQLPISKGCCPYEAVNEYLMTGNYEQETNGYPTLKYWNNADEYHQNKIKGPYDILKEALIYCIADVKVTSQLTRKLIEGYQSFCNDQIKLTCQFHIFQRPTISSNTHALFKQILYRAEKGQTEHLPGLQAPSEKMYDHIRKSVRGGRCYPSYLGLYEGPIYVYDICGMYASALTHPMPFGRTEDPLTASISIKTFQDKLDSPAKLSYFGESIKPMIVYADCYPPPLEHVDVLPPLCSRKSGRLCWTNEPLLGEVVTTIDLITLHNRGWKCKILTSEQLYAVWPEWKCITKEYVSINIAAKEKADKDKNMTQRSISKLLSNALYGSFATRLDNKKVVFANSMEKGDMERIANGKATITAQTTVINTCLPKKDTTSWERFFSNLPQTTALPVAPSTENEGNDIYPKSFIEGAGHVTFKPITHLTAACDDLILSIIEERSEWIENNRYPTQIASFVLAWTRAFTSEWASFLFEDDWGSNIENRSLKVVYGDTDSLFLTQHGHELMITKGKHRIKGYGTALTFDPHNPNLTWLVECETVCPLCKKIAYSTESVYLAPKLYGLKNIYCEHCDVYSAGKLRAKGHAKDCINYETLKKCFIDHDLLTGRDLQYKTQRKMLKRTLTAGNTTNRPFTVVEKQLTRTLRPWADMTMWAVTQSNNGYLLFPYDKKHPNPRQQELLTENPFWEST
ncbi:DNA polymerase [Duck adenovirus 1]|uniref:DNA polymerase n=1 Tax=Duck adenovirus 1 TaxID=130329 RepID=A0A0D3MVV5_DADV1|nr:DNA polymerase [Duck adenovirus 1]